MTVLCKLTLAGMLVLASCTVPRSAAAFDDGKWKNVDPETRQWFKSLRNSKGESCCDTADGVRIESPSWRENADQSFEVFAHDKWNLIPPDRVLKGTNRIGFAILWWPPSMEKPTCFLPGSWN